MHTEVSWRKIWIWAIGAERAHSARISEWKWSVKTDGVAFEVGENPAYSRGGTHKNFGWSVLFSIDADFSDHSLL